MASNKRAATKHIRDGIKSNYKKATYCEICGSPNNLELHHYTSVSLLLKDYAKANGISIATDKDVLAMRDAFYKIYSYELIEDTVTLCKEHHSLLHKTYGSVPPLHTASKQPGWVAKRRDALGIVTQDFIAENASDAEEEIEDSKVEVYSKTTRVRPIAVLTTSGLTAYSIRTVPLGDFKV